MLPNRLSEEVQRVLDWHWSQLEYGCSAPLSKVRHHLVYFKRTPLVEY